MALSVLDRIKEITTTTGTSTLTLAGAVTGFKAFSTIGDGNTTYYAVVHRTLDEWEVGVGTYTLSGTTLARTTVLSSSNNNNAVNFTAGTKEVFVTSPAAILGLAVADGVTRGIPGFTAADFNAANGIISLDYTNGQKASSSQPGFLSSADWSTFNAKGAGSVTSVGLAGTSNQITVTGSTPITGSGSWTLSIPASAQLSIAKITNLTGNGFVKTGSGDGTLSVDTNTYLTTAVTSIATSNGITGGTITGTGTISGVNAAADGATKGVATFTAADFNAASGVISLDYINGQAASGVAKGFLTSADWTTFNNKGSGTVTGSGTTGTLPKWTSSTALGNSILTESSGKIGVGNTAPVSKLHVGAVESDFPVGFPIRDFGYFSTVADTFLAANANLTTNLGATAWVLASANSATAAINFGLGVYAEQRGPTGSSMYAIDVQAIAVPALGVTHALNTGVFSLADNEGAGTVQSQQSFFADTNLNSAGGTVTNNFGFRSESQAGVGGTLNAAFYSVDQGSGANDYAFYSAGGKSVFPDARITKLGNLTGNGFVKTINADGTLSVDTATYLTAAGSVTSINKTGSTALVGAVTLTGGTNVTLTQSGQDISIAATGGTSLTDSASLRAALSDENGTGAALFDGATSATFVTPVLGVAAATSINKVAITAPATSATLTILNGKTFAVNKTITLEGTDSTTMTFPTTSATLARTDAANTFTGVQTMTSPVITTPWITTGINDSAGNSLIAVTATGSAVYGLTLANAALLGTVAVGVTSPTQASASVAGTPISITASPAIAGSSSAGAAAGGSITLTAGAAARLTSGNANGGDINLVPGALIGSGLGGQVLIPVGTSTRPGLAFTGGTTDGFSRTGSNQVSLLINNAASIMVANQGDLTLHNGVGTVKFGSSGVASADVGIKRNAAGVLEVNTTGAGQWAALLTGVRDAGTTTVTNGLTIGHQSTGTPAAGLGSALLFNINSSTTADQNAAQISALWTDATHATRTADIVFKAVNNAGALAEVGRWTGAGVFSAVNSVVSPIVKITSPLQAPSTGGAAITGNAVLVGGTVTVSTTKALTGSSILLTRKTSGGTIGTSITYTISNATSFTITSDNILDTSTFTWVIVDSY